MADQVRIEDKLIKYRQKVHQEKMLEPIIKAKKQELKQLHEKEFKEFLLRTRRDYFNSLKFSVPLGFAGMFACRSLLIFPLINFSVFIAYSQTSSNMEGILSYIPKQSSN